MIISLDNFFLNETFCCMISTRIKLYISLLNKSVENLYYNIFILSLLHRRIAFLKIKTVKKQ